MKTFPSDPPAALFITHAHPDHAGGTFTHCGAEIVRDEARATARLAALAKERGIRAELAHDGLAMVLR